MTNNKTIKIGQGGRITLPRAAREWLNVCVGDELTATLDTDVVELRHSSGARVCVLHRVSGQYASWRQLSRDLLKVDERDPT